MVGYKKAIVRNEDAKLPDTYVLVELDIPEDAQWQCPELENDPENMDFKFFNSLWGSYPNQNTEKKCRADKAKVLKIHGGFAKVSSLHEKEFTYSAGDTLEPTFPYDKGAFACGSGIHFFQEKDKAISYGTGSFVRNVKVEDGTGNNSGPSSKDWQSYYVTDAVVDRDQEVTDAE
jgi:hypothetical protein